MNEDCSEYSKLIIGLGKTGLASARYLSQQGTSFAVIDDRTEPPMLQKFLQEFSKDDLYLGSFDEQLLCDVSEVIISPGVSLQEPAIQTAMNNGTTFISDVEVFCREVKAPIIAVTGSNGKSTVVTLLAKVIQQAGMTVGLGGNIGTPVLELIREPEPDFYVLELSSFQLETVHSLNARASVVLNISEDHMDRYPGLEEYALAKSRVYIGDGVMVLNRDDPLVMNNRQSDRNTISFGSDIPDVEQYGIMIQDDKQLLLKGKRQLLHVDEMKIKGQHNYLNALVVLALAEAIEIPEASVIESLKQFRGLPHRCEWVANIQGVDWYNDSKGTNVGATVAAINGLAGKDNTILIAGGVGKGADFSPLAEVLHEKVKTVIVFGADADQIHRALKGHVEIIYASNLSTAVIVADKLSRADDLVLFSPACASFDMFENYEQRGDAFVEYVKQLEAGANE